MSYRFGKLWHLAIIWAIRKAFRCILQGVRFLPANHTRLSPTSENDSYRYISIYARNVEWKVCFLTIGTHISPLWQSVPENKRGNEVTKQDGHHRDTCDVEGNYYGELGGNTFDYTTCFRLKYILLLSYNLLAYWHKMVINHCFHCRRDKTITVERRLSANPL